MAIRFEIENLIDRRGKKVQYKDKELRENVEELISIANTAVETAEGAAATANEASEYVAGVEEYVDTKAEAAAGSAESAAADARAAETSATAAAGSAETAAESASSASSYATSAGSSAESASDSAAAASASATLAVNNAGAAASSAEAANTSAASAAGSVTDAQAQATAAAGSATAAAGSATAAANSATAAAGSASDAADSASDAEQALTDARAVAASIPADYSEMSADVDELKSALMNNLANIIADGYYRLEYIVSDGTQYFNSGVNPSPTLGFEIDFVNTKTPGNTNYANLIGSRVSSKNNDFEISTFTASSNAGTFRIGNTDNNACLLKDQRQRISYKNGKYIVDGTEYSISNQITSNNYPIYILSLNTAGASTYPLAAKLYGVKLYDGDTLVRDFVPAFKEETNEVGLYDLVNNVFYLNAATIKHDFQYSYSLNAEVVAEKFEDIENEISSVEERIDTTKEEIYKDVEYISDYNPPFKRMKIDLEMGGYDANGNEQADSTGVRWRTPDYIYISDMVDTAIVVPTGFTMYVCLYGEGNTFKVRGSWASGSTHDVAGNYSIRWTIIKANWTALTEEEANCVLIKEKIPWYEYLFNGANPLSEYPDYYDTQIKAVASNFIEDMLSVGANGDGFAFLTDVHWNGNYKHSPSLLYYLKENTNLDLILCGGDLIDRSTSNKASQITDMQDCVKAFKQIGIPFVTAIGNHERNSAGVTDSTLYLSENEVFSITQNSVNWMQLYYSDLERICFYLDRSATKTRYIFIDSGQNNIADYDITADEITWMTNVINSANQGWHIIIVVHQLGEYQSLNNPIDENNPFIYTTGAQGMLNALDALLENHNIEAIFTGHTHVDNNATTTGGIPIIWTNSDAKWQYHGMTQPSDGTVDAQCFDVVTMDYTNKTIHLRRVGRGADRTITY